MVELRKRKAPEPAPLPPTKKKTSTVKAAVNKAKEVVTGKPAEPATNEPTAAGDPTVGSSITLEGFGGEVETNDGEKTTFKKLVDDSKSGVVLFTYPKASTPGCKHTPYHNHSMIPNCDSINASPLTHKRHEPSLPLP